MSLFNQLLLQLILILLNAFFAATEIAVISLNEKKVSAMADDGNKKATKLLKIIEDPTKFLSTIQIGITLAGFLGSAFAADNFSEDLTNYILHILGLSEAQRDLVNTISVIIITVILSYFTLVLGELVPKRVAMKYKEKLAASACGVISFLTAVLRPIIWFLTVSTNGIIRLFGINPKEKDETVSEEDIVIMLDAGADEGTLKQEDIEYIKNVFKLEHLCAADIMTPRNSLVAVPEDISEEELVALIESEGYSRIPVYGENLDQIVGILHVRDYLLKHSREGFVLSDAFLAPDFVPETVHLDALFKDMQDSHTHMVVVVNEYGITLGVLTMEDIIEELVGEIWDEQDEAIESITATQDEDTYLVLSSASIDEFFEHFDMEKSEDITSSTVNGWISEVCGNIPEEGFEFTYENLFVTIIKADEKMTYEILVKVMLKAEDEDSEDSSDEQNEEEK